MHISSPKKILPTEGKSVWTVTILVALGGGEGCWLPNWKVGGQQERRKGAFRVNPTFLPAAVPMKSAWPWAELHPLLCTNMNPHSVKWAVFGLTVAMVQGCPGGLGSACPHEMGFQFIIIIYNKSRVISFCIYIKTLKIQLLVPCWMTVHWPVSLWGPQSESLMRHSLNKAAWLSGNILYQDWIFI